jgi:hypothetical protein
MAQNLSSRALLLYERVKDLDMMMCDSEQATAHKVGLVLPVWVCWKSSSNSSCATT